MLIVFEGIDGSGKTTLSNRVARELRQAGLRVRHVREDGKLASPVSEGLRLFTKNPSTSRSPPWRSCSSTPPARPSCWKR
ncbi:dTMP kinase [Cystobacter fuscus]